VQIHFISYVCFRFNDWLTIIQRLDLAKIPLEILNNQQGVCFLHFSPQQFTNSTKKKLKVTAVPDLIPSVSILEEEPKAEEEDEEEESPEFQPHKGNIIT